MSSFLKKAIEYLGSFSLAFTLLVLLGVLTFVGTLEQQYMSLYDVQIKYFESIVLVYWVGDTVPIPLPGGYLLLTVLSANLLVGGVLRMRKGKLTYGILVAHVGIVLLLLGSFIEHQFSTKGYMRLYEGEIGSEYQSLEEWEIVVHELNPAGGARDFIIPEDHFVGLDSGGSTTYGHADLPFDIVLTGYVPNSRPRPAREDEARLGLAADGFVLQVVEDAGAGNRQGRPGVTATLRPEDDADASRAILWGGERIPWAVTINGMQYQLHMRPCTWELPFSIRLKRFVHKRYPGMSMAREYSSYVAKIEDGKARDVRITMNEPLRHDGVTLYQSGGGPRNAAPGARLFSEFAVVANPSDQVPKYACYVIAVGLLWHFLLRLFLYLKAESRRRANLQSTGESA